MNVYCFTEWNVGGKGRNDKTGHDKVFSAKHLVNTAPNKILYFCLPFTGIHSLHIR